MNVVVNPGFAICAGGLKLEENQRTLAIQAADSNYDRIDTVVLRWNDNDSERICDLYIVEGIPAASPLRPELTRTESIWELGLDRIYFVNKNFFRYFPIRELRTHVMKLQDAAYIGNQRI